jgi:hypothetical protein
MPLDFPSSPTNGQTYNGYTYNSTKGVWVIDSSMIASMSTSASAPSNPLPGDLWYDSDTGFVFVYYNDGTSSQWVEIIASAVQAAITLGNLDDISDVNVTGVATGNALVFDATTANWVPSKDTDVIKMNTQTISASYSIPAGYNGMSAGPITIAAGVTVTIPTGSSWSIV